MLPVTPLGNEVRPRGHRGDEHSAHPRSPLQAVPGAEGERAAQIQRPSLHRDLPRGVALARWTFGTPVGSGPAAVWQPGALPLRQPSMSWDHKELNPSWLFAPRRAYRPPASFRHCDARHAEAAVEFATATPTDRRRRSAWTWWDSNPQPSPCKGVALANWSYRPGALVRRPLGFGADESGSDGRTRTSILLLNRELLSRLSYIGMRTAGGIRTPSLWFEARDARSVTPQRRVVRPPPVVDAEPPAGLEPSWLASGGVRIGHPPAWGNATRGMRDSVALVSLSVEPLAGLEPATRRVEAGCSCSIELRRRGYRVREAQVLWPSLHRQSAQLCFARPEHLRRTPQAAMAPVLQTGWSPRTELGVVPSQGLEPCSSG